MKKLLILGSVLMALALLPAAVFLIYAHPPTLATLFLIGLGAAGTVTFTYESFQHTQAYGGGFTGGSNAAPTAAQAQTIGMMTALVSFTDTDTNWTFTHNWGLSTAEVAALLPEVIINVIGSVQAVATAVAPVIAVTVGTNTVAFTKLQATGSGCQVSICIRRPHSLGF